MFDDVLPGWAYLVTAYALVFYVTWPLRLKQLFVKLHPVTFVDYVFIHHRVFWMIELEVCLILSLCIV